MALENGRQAVNLTQILKPDIVLMDVEMPELNGLEAAREIQETCPTPATLLGLLACTGLRISEALRLRQVDVDLDQGVITVHRSKLQQSRLVPLHLSAVRALEHYSRARDQRVTSDHFFVSERVVKDLGHEEPTFLLTNQLTRSASKLIERYARRIIIENSIQDGVDFFT